MADRKAKSFTFKVPPGAGLGEIKTAIENETTEGAIKGFQEIGAYEYLIELNEATQVHEIIENGFDACTNHIRCHPPHGYYLNVSIMGLKSYISDEDDLEKLSQYGEIKSSVIRLKYRQDHELAGLENGNRLVRIVLTSQSIPYSLQIGGEWCRVIHSNQQKICSNCNETGHTRKDSPTIECRCHQLGHLSFHCPTNDPIHTETADETPITTENDTPMDNTEDNTEPENTTEEHNDLEQMTEEPRETPPEMTATKPRDDNTTNTERPHQTDTDSDPAPLPRRQKKKPTPNLNAARPPKKHKGQTQKS